MTPASSATVESSRRPRRRGCFWRGVSRSLIAGRCDACRDRVIESFGMFAHDPAANESFERAQGRLILRPHKAKGIPHRLRSASPTNAVNVVLGVLLKVIINNLRDAVSINAPAGDIGRNPVGSDPVGWSAGL